MKTASVKISISSLSLHLDFETAQEKTGVARTMIWLGLMHQLLRVFDREGVSKQIGKMAPMKPSAALDLRRDAVRNVASRFRVINPRVFGSVLHGQDAEGSDLDLLVDPLPGTTLFDLGGLQVELEELLGVSVDLLTLGDLPKKFRDQVLAEARPV